MCACVRVRLGSFDLKVFCELRPGLIGWAVLNLGMMAKEKQVKGHVSASMMLVNAFQVRVLFIPQHSPHASAHSSATDLGLRVLGAVHSRAGQ